VILSIKTLLPVGILKIEKEETKQNKTEAKINRPFPWEMLLVIIGLLIIFTSYAIYKFKK